MFSIYQGLKVRTGSSDIAVIRATRRKFKAKVRRDPSFREQRKATYRTMLKYHHQAQDLVRQWRL